MITPSNVHPNHLIELPSKQKIYSYLYAHPDLGAEAAPILISQQLLDTIANTFNKYVGTVQELENRVSHELLHLRRFASYSKGALDILSLHLKSALKALALPLSQTASSEPGSLHIQLLLPPSSGKSNTTQRVPTPISGDRACNNKPL